MHKVAMTAAKALKFCTKMCTRYLVKRNTENVGQRVAGASL